MDAVTEGKVRIRRTCRVELVRMIEASRVVVGREQRQNHGFTGNDRDAAARSALLRNAVARHAPVARTAESPRRNQ
jgi:hypothetical protein